jgi:hypothetical protein
MTSCHQIFLLGPMPSFRRVPLRFPVNVCFHMIASPFEQPKPVARSFCDAYMARLHHSGIPGNTLMLLLGIRQVGLSLLVGPAWDTLLPITLYVEG